MPLPDAFHALTHRTNAVFSKVANDGTNKYWSRQGLATPAGSRASFLVEYIRYHPARHHLLFCFRLDSPGGQLSSLSHTSRHLTECLERRSPSQRRPQRLTSRTSILWLRSQSQDGRGYGLRWLVVQDFSRMDISTT